MQAFAMRGAALALFFFFAAVLPAQELKGPRIEVKQEHYDMGKIAQGTMAVHVFEVRNTGDAPLVIERLQPS